MNGLNKFLAATSLSAAMLFSGAAQAMQIQQFDKMVDDDQAEFVSALIQGAEKVLSDAGRLKDKEKVRYLFTTNAAGDKISIGMTEFIINLALVRVDDAENAKTHPNDPRLEVEDAMFLTLQKNHIDLPDSFFTVASNFKPKFPPQSKEKKEKKN